MDPRIHIGRMLIIAGIVIVIAGVAVLYGGKIPFIGRLPGDINIHGKHWSVHVPIVTSIVASILLTILLNLFFRR